MTNLDLEKEPSHMATRMGYDIYCKNDYRLCPLLWFGRRDWLAVLPNPPVCLSTACAGLVVCNHGSR